MNTAFYSGLAGLSAYSGALNVVGNNLANLNTSGFKASTVDFEDLVTRTFGGTATNGAGNPMQVGLGTMTSNIGSVFSQGSIKTTSEATNVALEGNGFFVVGDSAQDRFYTRAGDFFIDEDGFLVNPSGKYVLGYTERDPANNNEIIASGDLNMIGLAANQTAEPNQSTLFQVFANLDVREAVDGTYSSSTTVYDGKGAPHTLTVEFTHTGLNADNEDEWTWAASIPDADVVGGAAGAGAIDNGTLVFDDTGTLVSGSFFGGNAVATDLDPIVNIDLDFPQLANGANDDLNMTVTWELLDDNNVPRITGYPIPSATTSTYTDGYPPGALTSLVVDKDGIIQGVYSNGRTMEIAQMAIAQFNSPKGLLRMGRNLFTETNASGIPSLGAADTGGRGAIVGSSLESSNVDMAVEFTQMLVFERGYQANSKIISASDTITQTAISLVR